MTDEPTRRVPGAGRTSRLSVLVTGASGFVGRHVVARLARDGHAVRAAQRAESPVPEGVEIISGAEMSSEFAWERAARGCDAIVHTAARVHVMRDTPDGTAAFRRINVEGTLRLARAAASVGVRRFVFLSSIKVNGEETPAGRPFTAADSPAPRDAYGRSKAEAEDALRGLAAAAGGSMEVVIIRPVLVYGPGVKANFLAMMRWLARGVPLPFGALRNRRSLVGSDNLIDLIVTTLSHPSAGNEVFLVSDGEDLSTPELLRRTARALARRARLIPVPPGVLEVAAAALGKRDVARRLTGSLQVDISGTTRRLGWTPPRTVDDGLRTTARWFLTNA